MKTKFMIWSINLNGRSIRDTGPRADRRIRAVIGREPFERVDHEVAAKARLRRYTKEV